MSRREQGTRPAPRRARARGRRSRRRPAPREAERRARAAARRGLTGWLRGSRAARHARGRRRREVADDHRDPGRPQRARLDRPPRLAGPARRPGRRSSSPPSSTSASAAPDVELRPDSLRCAQLMPSVAPCVSTVSFGRNWMSRPQLGRSPAQLDAPRGALDGSPRIWQCRRTSSCCPPSTSPVARRCSSCRASPGRRSGSATRSRRRCAGRRPGRSGSTWSTSTRRSAAATTASCRPRSSARSTSTSR